MTRGKRRSNKRTSLIISHLSNVKRALLEGDKRPAFLDFVSGLHGGRTGIYALHDSRGRLYYAGKASDLPRRLNQHLKDHHRDSWDTMSLYFVKDEASVSVLEGLVVATAKPPGNRRRPRVGTDLRRRLKSFLKEDEGRQIEQMIYPERKLKEDRLFSHITEKRLANVSQSRLSRVLGISQARVSQLKRDGALRQYIREAGKRDAVLLLLQKELSNRPRRKPRKTRGAT